MGIFTNKVACTFAATKSSIQLGQDLPLRCLSHGCCSVGLSWARHYELSSVQALPLHWGQAFRLQEKPQCALYEYIECDRHPPHSH